MSQFFRVVQLRIQKSLRKFSCLAMDSQRHKKQIEVGEESQEKDSGVKSEPRSYRGESFRKEC
ncbi:hypothetical protein T265_07290 [Opisthorchis viverrini]|uniref:Uncharacterized protein n=1 Tax=Opisthorchis viverrini TaxID=6198 RepID=A0A074ZPE7_OPIVI|nr:hypothetical protein T265_07290 [Opisthorchis viverrini]KER25185.1 hypothetical protein T265_07290 [Opisthorchis viverrini]